MPNLCTNLQWEITYFDPKLFEWDDLPEPGAPPEWKSPGLAFSGLSGVNFPVRVYYTSPNYKWETRPPAVGYICTLQADQLDAYLVKGSRNDVMFRVKFSNGAILEVITKSPGWNGLRWELTLGSDTQSSGSLTQAQVHTQLLKIPFGNVMVDFTYFFDYTYQLDTTTAYNNFGWIASGFVGSRYDLEDFPIIFTTVATLATSEKIFNLLNGSQANEDVGPENEGDGENTANFNYVDEKIDFPDLPDTDGLSTGLLSLYKMNSGLLNSLSRTLWDDNFFNTIVKNFDSPLENIIALYLLPVDVSGTEAEVMIGNFQTSIVGEKITGQFIDLDGGSVHIQKIFGHQFDFKPVNELQIYIPYIGIRQIELDDCVGGDIYLKYRLDLLSGNLLAMIRVVNDESRYYHDSVEYYFEGNCATSLPLSGANYMSYYGSLIGGAVRATTGLSQENIGQAVSGASSMMSAKPSYERAGSLSGNFGFMGQQTAFIIMSSPVTGIAGNLQEEMGLRSNRYSAFSALSGFQKIYSFHPNETLSNECTEEELMEIERLLKEGVFF